MNLTDKISLIQTQFSSLHSREALYQKIMEWSKKLAPFNPDWVKEEHRVTGCQSQMHLYSVLKGGKVYFYASSDALISAGLAAILIEVYNGEPPDAILITPPNFLQELGIPSVLSLGRANGLASLYLKMKQQALRHLLDLSGSAPRG